MNDAPSTGSAPLPVPLPLFPLQTVLFPGGLLPLQIFEVRYLDMVSRCHREQQPFGVVCLTQGHEVRAADAPEEHFERVGTLAWIESLERPQPGLLRIRCRGGERFRLQPQTSVRQPNGLWVGQVDQVLPADTELAVPADLQWLGTSLSQMLEHWSRQLGASAQGADALPVASPWQLDDCGWLANRWAELLPLPLTLRQQLMALDSPLLRLELVADLVEQARRASSA